MRGLAAGMVVVLLWPTMAVAFDPPAGISCPLYIDQNAAPFGMCIACESPAGPITNCPVTELGNGSLGCACQNGNNVVRCTDPNIQRCGGILPFCSALDICYLNTVTTCVNEAGNPAYAPDCYVGSPSMPLGCECWTVTLRRPLSQEEKAAWAKAYQVLGAFVSAALMVFVAPPSVPVSLSTNWKSAATVLGEAAVLALGITNDPPMSDYTTITYPQDVPLTPHVTPSGGGLKPAQVASLNAASALFTDLQKALTAAEWGLFRAAGAQEAASITYYEAQLDAYDVAANQVKGLFGQMATTMAAFCTSQVWNNPGGNGLVAFDYRPLYQAAGICDPVAVQGMIDLSTTNLMSQR